MVQSPSLISKLHRGLTSPLRLLPDFIIIGGKKCGTSSLYNYVAEHPDVAPAFRKEVHFFDNHTGKRGALLYRSYFPTRLHRRRVKRDRGSNIITGEATPYYLFYPPAPARVRRVVPDARLIAMLRNPVDRAYSHYHHEARRGTEELSFEQAIEVETQRLENDRYGSPSHRRYSYLSRGIYVDQLRNWREYFPKDQLLILRSEDLFEHFAAVLSETLEFLGLTPMEHTNFSKDNRGSYLEMDPATRGYLEDYFRPHNERLYEYLDRDFGWDH